MDLSKSLQSQWVFPLQTFFRRIDWKLFFLLVLPILLIVLNDGWLLSYAQWNFIDTWIYLGYFLDLKEHLNVFPKAYFGTRLPWILPGYLTHDLFSPWVAHYVLHLAFHCTAIASFYLILKRLWGRHSALLTAVLLGCHFYFLEALGSDYIDGAGITYLLLTLLMVTDLADSRYLRLRLCCAGVFYGCMIYTQLFLITYTPLIILYYFFVNRRFNRLSSLLFVMAGFIGLTLFFCTLTYFLNGRFWFFKYLLKWTSNYAVNTSPWWSPISTWWTMALWLVLPAITFVGSLLVLIFPRATRESPHRKILLFLQVHFILAVLIHLFWEFKMQQPVLNMQYYASYMLPSLFLALGAQLAIVVNVLSRKEFYTLLGGVLFVSLLPYAPFVVKNLNFIPVWLPIPLGIAGIAYILMQSRFKKTAVFSIALSIALINLLSTRSWPSNNGTALRKNAYLAVVKSVSAIQTMDPESRSRFWYNDAEPLGNLYRSVASTYLWAYRLISEEFPNPQGKGFVGYNMKLDDRVFILSADDNVLEKANQSLAQAGFRGEFLGEKTVEQGDMNYKITYFKVCSF